MGLDIRKAWPVIKAAAAAAVAAASREVPCVRA